MSDHISIGMLTRVFSPEVVDRIVTESGRAEKRHRLLPIRVVVYYVLGLALFSDSSYEEVMRMLVEGLSWAGDWAKSWNVPTKAALFKARMRLGAQPLREHLVRWAMRKFKQLRERPWPDWKWLESARQSQLFAYWYLLPST